MRRRALPLVQRRPCAGDPAARLEFRQEGLLLQQDRRRRGTQDRRQEGHPGRTRDRARRASRGRRLSSDGAYAYVGNYLDSNISVLKIEGTQVTDTGKKLKLPGPASLVARSAEVARASSKAAGMLRPPHRTYGNFGYHLAHEASQVDARLRQHEPRAFPGIGKSVHDFLRPVGTQCGRRLWSWRLAQRS
jgi:hypothetical protein